MKTVGRRLSRLLLGAVPLLILACTDGTGPVQSRTIGGAGTSYDDAATASLAGMLVSPVERSTPLAEDVSWSFVAGPDGAVSSRPDLGVTIAIPAGALSATETITVTALAGSAVAYRFEPHLEFAQPVQLTQSLVDTDVPLTGLLVLNGAHFAGNQLARSVDGLVPVTETVSAVVNLLAQTVTFAVDHFSGWIVASG